jgi:hypothetical protein
MGSFVRYHPVTMASTDKRNQRSPVVSESVLNSDNAGFLFADTYTHSARSNDFMKIYGLLEFRIEIVCRPKINVGFFN